MTDYIGPHESMPIIRARLHGDIGDRMQILADGTILKGDGHGALSVDREYVIDLCRGPYNVRPGDDVTDKLQAAINAIAATGKDGEIVFSQDGIYNLGGPVQTGTAQGYNYAGQILLPARGDGQGGSIKIRGGSQSPQAVVADQRGVILRSSATSGWVIDAVPGYSKFGAVWTAVTLMLEDLSIQVPGNPTVGGVNVSKTLRYRQRNVNIIDTTSAWPAAGAADVAALWLPDTQNSAEIVLEGMNMIRGFPVGIRLTEHATINSVYIANCRAAFRGKGGGHANWFGHVRVETCPVVFTAQTGDGLIRVSGFLDYENLGTGAQAPVSFVQSPYDAYYGRLNLYFGGGFANGSFGWSGNRSLDLESATGKVLPWRESHPNDTFVRCIDPVTTDAPGFAWPSLHPWRTYTGSVKVAGAKLQSTNGGGQSLVLIPVKNAGCSRAVEMITTLAASAYQMQMYVGRVEGGTPNVIIVQITGGAVNLVVNGTQRQTAAGAVTGGTTYKVTCAVMYGALGTPSTVDVYLNGTLLYSYTLTSTESSSLAAGTNYPYLEDGVSFFDGTSVVTSFKARGL